MSVQIYKDGKLTPVAGELYESGNVVPLANHANTANTANRAIADANGKDIATTFMPRGIDFKNGPIKKITLATSQSFDWTATEDCFMLCNFTSGIDEADNVVINIDGINITKMICNADSCLNLTLPIVKGQNISGKNGYKRQIAEANLQFYRYIY